MKCFEIYKECAIACEKKECRQWINYKKDFNCSNVAIARHGNMTLAEIAKRLDLSIVRIKQIQDKAVQKLKKNTLFLK